MEHNVHLPKLDQKALDGALEDFSDLGIIEKI